MENSGCNNCKYLKRNKNIIFISRCKHESNIKINKEWFADEIEYIKHPQVLNKKRKCKNFELNNE